MDCIVRKLKASVNNDDLPVFTNIVLKNYIATTQDGQYVRITGHNFVSNKIKIEVVYQSTVVSAIETTVAGAAGNNYIQQKNQYCRLYNQAVSELITVSANTDISVMMNTSTGAYSINGTTGTCTSLVGSYTAYGFVFGAYNRYDSKAGVIRIKSIKFTDLETNDVFDLVPAEVDGVAVLIDQTRGVSYGEYNSGTLICG